MPKKLTKNIKKWSQPKPGTIQTQVKYNFLTNKEPKKGAPLCARRFVETQKLFDKQFMWGSGPQDYADDVPLEGPKAKMVKKWSGNGFGPFQMTCPKSGQKVPKKWSKKGPRKIWDHKKTNFAWVFDK